MKIIGIKKCEESLSLSQYMINEDKHYPCDSKKTSNNSNNVSLSPLKSLKYYIPLQETSILFSAKKPEKIPRNYTPNNTAYYDINSLTIKNNTNITNLNVYLFINPEDLNNEKKKKMHNLNIINTNEPNDTIKKKLDEIKKNKTKKIKIGRKFTQNNTMNYSIKKCIKSPTNRTKVLFLRNKINKIDINDNKIYSFREKYPLKTIVDLKKEPKGKFNLSEFIKLDQIGKGTYGKIFSVKWTKNNKKYALKKEIVNDLQYIEKRQNIVKIINSFIKKNKNKGIIQIYSNLYKKNKDKYIYYELMEIGESDWDKEINLRRNSNSYYSEKDLLKISSQLIKTLSLLQKNHITHRDIKPQNILIINGQYKLCDFGEIRIMEREGLIVQRIRGSELYMSPILFYALRSNIMHIKHNTYKSDVFSLGMCLVYAATMYFNCLDEIREVTDMKTINSILNKYLSKRYSQKFISLIELLIQIKEELRPDFIHLEEIFFMYYLSKDSFS